MSEKLQITLLGGFEASLGSDNRLALKGRKTQALLALLAVSPGTSISREKLTYLLWSDRSDEQARGSLRQALAELRRALGEDDTGYLKADRDSLMVDASSTICDALELERLAGDGGFENLEQAVELYRGDLLDGISIADPSFEEWLTVERRRVSELAQGAMRRLLEYQMQSGESAKAITTARKLLALDPLQESAHRTLMRLYVEQGDRSMALKQYQACWDVLRAELGVEPEGETKKLCEEIRQGDESSLSGVSPTLEYPPSRAVLTLPDKPSIAVLPFTNMSGDAEQEYFADGITQDIITELSRVRSLFVIARNSVFTYKGQAVDIRDVGAALGVQYVVEGSVRKTGNRVRVTVELSESLTGNHVWGERYDRDVEDVFAVQDDITSTIVGTLVGRVETAGQERALRLSKNDLAAYDLYLKGRAYWLRFNREDNAKALEYLRQAEELYPTSSTVHEGLAVVHLLNWMAYWVEHREAALKLAYEHAHRAVQLDENDCRAQMRLGEILWFQGKHEEAKPLFARALRLNPNDAETVAMYALYLCARGDHDDSLAQFELAARLDPIDSNWRPWVHGIALYSARRYNDAIEQLMRIHDPINESNGWLAASLGQAGRSEEARHYLDVFLKNAEQEFARFPGHRLSDWVSYWDDTMRYRNREDLDHLLAGLKKAGWKD